MQYDDWYQLNWQRLNVLYAATGGDELCLEEFHDFCINRYEVEGPDAEGSCHEEDIIMARIDDDELEEPPTDISS